MPHILIIDDEAWLANKLAVHLEREGHRVATFTGEIVPAFRLIEKLHTDLIILEHFRPGEFDGMDLVYVLRNTPALAHLPIILMASKNAWYDVLPFLGSFGFQPEGYLVKPFSFDECSEMISRLLSRPERIIPPGDSMQ